ncbi:MAG: phage tail protein [Acidaminobacteraceae bacterium]
MPEMFGNLYGDEDKKEKPVANSRFGIEIDGIIESSFANAKGVSVEIETMSYHEGGMLYEHTFPTKTKFSNITLERGTTSSDVLAKWILQIQEGIIDRKDFAIILWNPKGEIVKRWNFSSGLPVKWSVSDFDGMGSSVAIETIELSHLGMKL